MIRESIKFRVRTDTRRKIPKIEEFEILVNRVNADIEDAGPATEDDLRAAGFVRREEQPCSTCGGTGVIDQRLGGTGAGARMGEVPCPDCTHAK